MSFTSDQKAFAEKWLHGLVRPKGSYFKVPCEPYLVTAALYKYEGDVTIIALYGADKKFFTFKIGPEKLEEAIADLEILDPPP